MAQQDERTDSAKFLARRLGLSDRAMQALIADPTFPPKSEDGWSFAEVDAWAKR